MIDEEKDLFDKIPEDKWYEISKLLSISERKNLAMSTKKFYFFYQRNPELNAGIEWNKKPATVKIQVPYSINVNVIETNRQLLLHQNNYYGSKLSLLSLKDGVVLLEKSCQPSYKFFVFNDKIFLLFESESMHILSGSTLELTHSVQIILPNGVKVSDSKNQFCHNTRYVFIASYDGIYYIDILNILNEEKIVLQKLQHDDIPDFDIIFKFVNIFDEYLIIEGRLDPAKTCKLLIHLDGNKVCDVDDDFAYLEPLDPSNRSSCNYFTKAKNGRIYFIHRNALHELIKGNVRIVLPDLPFKYRFSIGIDRSTYSVYVLSESHMLCLHKLYSDGNQLYDELPSTKIEAFVLDYINNKIIYEINWVTSTTKVLSILDNSIVFENRDPIEYKNYIVIEQYATRRLKFSDKIEYDTSSTRASGFTY